MTESNAINDYVKEGLNMKDQVAYQDNTVISKTLIKKDTGTLSLFAFDAGEGLSEHSAPFDAFVHVLDGTAEIIISGTAYNISAGEMIIMPADQPHAVKANQKFKMLLVMIK